MPDDLQALINDVLASEADKQLTDLAKTLSETVAVLRQAYLARPDGAINNDSPLMMLLNWNIETICRAAAMAGHVFDGSAMREAALAEIEAPGDAPAFTVNPDAISLTKH